MFFFVYESNYHICNKQSWDRNCNARCSSIQDIFKKILRFIYFTSNKLEREDARCYYVPKKHHSSAEKNGCWRVFIRATFFFPAGAVLQSVHGLAISRVQFLINNSCAAKKRCLSFGCCRCQHNVQHLPPSEDTYCIKRWPKCQKRRGHLTLMECSRSK